MKKQTVILLSIIVLSVLSFTSCEPFVVNKITVRNLAAAEVQFSLRAKTYSVQSGETLILDDFKKGSFQYYSTFSVPAGVTGVETEGDFEGEVILNAGTEVLFLYQSNIVDNKYSISIYKMSSDDINRPDPFASGD
ncbi:MAG: hypothetical protein RBR74_02365 [Ignavibacteriaceae bacterium]|jgi:hypothetical protein|nr:hypothetical protein [Ignavibacteriaceae bacterium]